MLVRLVVVAKWQRKGKDRVDWSVQLIIVAVVFTAVMGLKVACISLNFRQKNPANSAGVT